MFTFLCIITYTSGLVIYLWKPPVYQWTWLPYHLPLLVNNYDHKYSMITLNFSYHLHLSYLWFLQDIPGIPDSTVSCLELIQSPVRWAWTEYHDVFNLISMYFIWYPIIQMVSSDFASNFQQQLPQWDHYVFHLFTDEFRSVLITIHPQHIVYLCVLTDGLIIFSTNCLLLKIF